MLSSSDVIPPKRSLPPVDAPGTAMAAPNVALGSHRPGPTSLSTSFDAPSCALPSAPGPSGGGSPSVSKMLLREAGGPLHDVTTPSQDVVANVTAIQSLRIRAPL